MIAIDRIDHFVMRVADVEATCAFYAKVLGMEVVSFGGELQRKALRFGRQKINLHQAGEEFEPRAAQATVGSGDLCFLCEGSIEDWEAHLRGQGIEIELGPVLRTGATWPITSVYVRDPDGNLVEVSVPDLS